MGKTDSGKAGEVGKCRESMSAQQTESREMGSGIQKRWRESFGTQSDYTYIITFLKIRKMKKQY